MLSMRRSSRPLVTTNVVTRDFGPALGPDAAKRTIVMFEAVSYFVVNAAADWVMKHTIGDMLAA